MTEEMSKDCKYFVQHAWKQDLCANCFESREDHRKKLRQLNILVPEFAANVKSILRRDNDQRQHKNVIFRMSLTEIIGYGGDDLDDYSEYNSDNCDENAVNDSKNENEDDGDNEETITSKQNNSNSDEEDRALCNLTRSNTNFNRSIANLNDMSLPSSLSSDVEKTTPKYFDNLMLGNIHKDSESNSKTLLVSITPFGASDYNSCMISAEAPVNKVPIDDRKKRIIPEKIIEISSAESNSTSTSVANHLSLKLNKTSEKKCQEINEPINVMKSNCNEQMNERLNFDKVKNDDIGMKENLILNQLVESITLNVEQTKVESEAENVIESVNIEIPLSENHDNDRIIDDEKLNDEKIFEDTSSNSSSIDCSTINSESSFASPKPRNSFLHSGKNVNNGENLFIKADDVNEMRKSSSSLNVVKNNSSNIQSQEQIVLKTSEKPSEDLSSSIFTRKPMSSLKSDCPVVREKEKRERATSCSPKFRKMDETSLNRNYNNDIPESMSKRSATRSLSRQSSSSYSQALSNTNGLDDEIKKKNKTRFSLKRLLRIGSSKKDLNITTIDSPVDNINNLSSLSQFKNKPEIIHPLELDGAAVEILYHDKLIKITDEITSIKSPNVKVAMRDPPPPPPTNASSSTQSDCHQLSMSKFARLSLHDEHERTKLSTHDTDREHPSCHSISTNTTSTVHSISTDSIHTGIHNFEK